MLWSYFYANFFLYISALICRNECEFLLKIENVFICNECLPILKLVLSLLLAYLSPFRHFACVQHHIINGFSDNVWKLQIEKFNFKSSHKCKM